MYRNEEGQPILPYLILFFLILIIFYIFYHYGDTGEVVKNNEKESIDNNIGRESYTYNNDLYDRYIKNILNDAKKKELNNEEIKKQVDSEIEKDMEIPEFDYQIKDIGLYDRKEFIFNFNNILKKQISMGMTKEIVIISSQDEIQDSLIPLSQYDKETILNSIKLYRDFAEQIKNLKTPKIYQVKSEEAVKASLNLSYILEKILYENNKYIYSLWTIKYSENLFAIILSRYVE